MSRALLVVTALAACGRVGFGSASGSDDIVGDAAGSDASDGGDDASMPTFFDSFQRPANTEIGNGWIEKTPNVFSITDNKVTRTLDGDWTTNQVSRPPSEDLADVEVSIEFTLLDVSQPDWPQVFVRGEPSTFAGYYIWLEAGPSTYETPIDIARKGSAESWWTALDQKMAPVAVAGERYRLRIAARGANPVVVDGDYERWNGSAWDAVVTLHGEDSSPEAITGAGTWGFDGHTGTTTGPYVYDNFTAFAR
jgi:hypothetical protein